MADYTINKTITVASGYADDSGDINSAVISYELFYPVGNTIALMTGTLAGANRQVVRLSAPNGFLIEGELVTQVSADEIVLRANLFYGFNGNMALQNHFEGTIAIYPLVTPPVPLIPLDPPLPPFPDNDNFDFSENIAIDAPLFPYIYIQPWPTETAQDCWLNFISYNGSVSPSTSLYSLLIPLAQKKDRKGMETLAIQFVQNDKPFTQGEYYSSLLNVPGPFLFFPEVYDLLAALEDAETYEELCLSQLGYVTVAELKDFVSADNKAVIDQVWQNYFALTILTGYNESLFINLNKILLVWNILQKLYTEQPYPLLPLAAPLLQALLQATIILPGIPTGETEPIFPLPPYQGSVAPVTLVTPGMPVTPVTPGTSVMPVTNNWIEPYAIGQLKMTKYRLLRYEPGEVSQIQSILKGEKRKVVNRSFSATGEQTLSQDNGHNETHNESNETTGELLVEAQKTVAALTKNIKYDKLTTTYGPPTQGILDGAYSKSIVPGAPSKEDTNHFSSLVLNKTINRIQETVLKSRTFSRYSEKEEISSSIFNNTAGAAHFRGIYRWVNKVYRVSVHNYGYRFLLELHIDNPSAAYVASQETLNNIDLTKPLSPKEKGINSFTDITTGNYVLLASYYRLTKVSLPPEPVASASITLGMGETEKCIPLPAGYVASEAVITAQIAAGSALTAITGIVGTVAFTVATGATETKPLNKESGQLTIAVVSNNLPVQPPVQTEDFILNATIHCVVTDRKTNEWQVSFFNEITQAYEKMMADYNDRLTRWAMDGQQTNPLLLNNIEKSCLYKSCLATLLNVAAVKTGEAPDITPSPAIVNKQRRVQFSEEAFEWHEMTYRFDDQPSPLSYALQGKEDSLRPFLQAASAVVYLPVRPAYNFSILYYLSAGILWTADYPYIPINSTDVETAAHLKKTPDWGDAGREESYRNITLPTDMQVVQESNQLPDYSLPK